MSWLSSKLTVFEAIGSAALASCRIVSPVPRDDAALFFFSAHAQGRKSA